MGTPFILHHFRSGPDQAEKGAYMEADTRHSDGETTVLCTEAQESAASFPADTSAELQESVAAFLRAVSQTKPVVPAAFNISPRDSLTAVLKALRNDPRANTYRRAAPLIHAYRSHARPEELEEFYTGALHHDVGVAAEIAPYLSLPEHPADRLVRDLLQMKSYRRIFRNGFRAVGLSEDPALLQGICYADTRPASPETARLILSLYFSYRYYFLGVGRRKNTAKTHIRVADALAGMLAPGVLETVVASLLPVEEMVQEPHRLWAFCRFAAELSIVELSRQLDGKLIERFDEKLLSEALRLSDTFEAQCVIYEIELGLSEKAFLDAVISKKNVDIARWIRLRDDGTRIYSADIRISLQQSGRYGKFTLQKRRGTPPQEVMDIIRADTAFKIKRLNSIVDRLQAHLTAKFPSTDAVPFAAAIGKGAGGPIGRLIVSSVLWHQKGGGVFLYTEKGPITVSGEPYTFLPGIEIRLAHKGHMDDSEVDRWIAYFRTHHLEPLVWQFGPMR